MSQWSGTAMLWSEAIIVGMTVRMILILVLIGLLLRWLWRLSFRNREDDRHEYRDMLRRGSVRRFRRLRQIGILLVHLYIVVEVITWDPLQRNLRQTFMTPILSIVELFLLDTFPPLRRRWNISMAHVVSFVFMCFVFAVLTIADWYIIQRSLRRHFPEH